MNIKGKSPDTGATGINNNQLKDNENKGINPDFNFENISFEDIKLDAERLAENNNPIQVKNIFSGFDLMKKGIDKIPTILEPILPKVGLCGFAGSSDTGKSSFLRQLAVSVSVGDPEFLGFKLNTQHKSAIYVSTEDDEFAVSYLLHKTNCDKQLEPDNYKNLFFIFDTSDLIKKLEEILLIKKVDLIVIDAFTDLYGKSMNDTNQVRTFLNEYSQLAQKYKCLIIFLHHTGKRTEDLIPSKHNLLGSQGFEAKMRLVIELRNDNYQPGKRHLCIVKGNYLPREYKTESFVLTFNDNLQFAMTEERKLFDELKADDKSEIKAIVKKLKEDGKTQKEIESELKISQSTVSRYLKS